MQFPREAAEEIQLPPPAETTGRTFIGPAPAPRPGRRKPVGSGAPQPAVTVKTNPFAPVTTEVIAPELIAAAIAAEAKLAAAVAAAAAEPLPPAAEPPPPAAQPTPEAGDTVLSGEPFELEAVALDAGTLTVELPVAHAATQLFVPDDPTPLPAPMPIAEEPRVVFHSERPPFDIGQTDPDLPPPPAQLAPEQIAAAIAPAPAPVATPIPTASPMLSPEPAPEILQPGTLVDEYELVGWMASDPTGTLYSAHDSVEQPFAIKVISRGVCRDEASLERLAYSARSSRELDSVHLVEVLAAGRLHDGRVYLVMEPLRGETLGARMARGRLPIDEAMEILSQLAAAVADVHKAGVHRCDIGPDSVIVRHSEEGIEVKLLQVGLAQMTRGSSPERTRGDAVGAPADIHALGLLAQHMLVGTPVDQSLVVSDARPEVPAAVDLLVDSMLANDPRRRPTALDVQAAARKLAHALYRGVSIELPFRLQARLWLQKPKNRILLGAQVLLAVAGLLSYLLLRGDDSSDASAASAQPAAEETAPAALPEPAPDSPEPAEAAPATAAGKTAPAKTAPAKTAPAKTAPAKTAPAKVAAEPKKKTEPAPRPAEAPKKKEAPPKSARPTPAPAPSAKPPAPAPAASSGDRDAPIKDPFGDM